MYIKFCLFAKSLKYECWIYSIERLQLKDLYLAKYLLKPAEINLKLKLYYYVAKKLGTQILLSTWESIY